MTADSLSLLFARVLFDLGFGLIGAKENLYVVLTTESIFLPVKLFDKLSGVQQGNARLLRKDRRSLQALQPTAGHSPRAAGCSTAVRNLYPLPASTIGRQDIFLRELSALPPVDYEQDYTQGMNRHHSPDVPRPTQAVLRPSRGSSARAEFEQSHTL
jgi:hypothetical protein